MNQIIRYSLICASIASFGLTSNALAVDYPQNHAFGDISSASSSHQIAQRRWDDDEKGYKDDKGEKLVERLNLTTEQRNQMAQIRNKYQPQFNSLREEIRNERNTLSQMMRNNQSQEQMRSQHQKIVSLDQKIHNLRFESMLEMRNVLTPEQREEWANMMGEGRMSRGRRNR